MRRRVGQYAAVRLFIERAVAVKPGFAVTNENAPAVAAISARLRGMPLAIELAAARIKLLSPEAILSRLEHQLDVLSAGARDLPARQQTLRGAIAWSYDILDEPGRRLLDRLSVFAGGSGPRGRRGGLRSGRRDRRRRHRRRDGPRGPESRARRRDGRGRAARPPARVDPGIRRGTAGRTWRDRGDRGAPSRLVHGPGRASPSPNSRAPISAAGWTASNWSTTTSGRSSIEQWPRPEPAVAIRTAFAMWRFWQKHGHLGEARRRLDAIDAAAWSHDDPRLRARLDGGARRGLLVAGRPRRHGGALRGGPGPLAGDRRRARDRQRLLQRGVHLRHGSGRGDRGRCRLGGDRPRLHRAGS